MRIESHWEMPGSPRRLNREIAMALGSCVVNKSASGCTRLSPSSVSIRGTRHGLIGESSVTQVFEHGESRSQEVGRISPNNSRNMRLRHDLCDWRRAHQAANRGEARGGARLHRSQAGGPGEQHRERANRAQARECSGTPFHDDARYAVFAASSGGKRLWSFRSTCACRLALHSARHATSRATLCSSCEARGPNAWSARWPTYPAGMRTAHAAR